MLGAIIVYPTVLGRDALFRSSFWFQQRLLLAQRHACNKCVDTCKSDPSVSDERTCTPADKTRTQNREEMQFSECDKERREGM